MKRVVNILMVMLFIFAIPLNVIAASTPQKQVNIYYFEDGSYLIETLNDSSMRASGTKTGSKTQSYYDGDGNLDWKAVLTATFTYSGATSTCTSSNCSVTIYDSAWYTVSKSATKNGNTATANVTMSQKLLGVSIGKKSTTITLKCDKDGNLS